MTVGSTRTITAPAGVASRIETIRSRLSTMSGPTSSDTATTSVTGAAFDPFGAAYQAAISGFSPGASSVADSSTDSSGGGSSGRIESVGSRAAFPGGAVWTGGAVRVGSSASAPAVASPNSPSTAGALSGEEIARMAYKAGFRGDDLVSVVAISKRESNWKPSAYNGNAGTGDRSYGLMQINMIGDLGPARLRQFGLSNNEQLLDPQTNLDAAYRMYSDSGNSLNAWGGYKGFSNTFNTNLDAARAVVDAAGLADAG